MESGRKNLVWSCGFLKTGNTWAHFVLLNYFNILNFNAGKTISFNDLNEILLRTHPNEKLKNIVYGKSLLSFYDGFPSVVHSHNPRLHIKEYREFFDKFDKMVYIIRNPYDTMISLYHYEGREKGIKYDTIKTKEFENFVERKLPQYIEHVSSLMPMADLVLEYDKLRENTDGFKYFIKLFVDEIDDNVFEKAVRISSFDSIREIEKRNMGNYIIPFTRDGRVGQYKTEMDEKMIKYIKKEWKKL